MRKHLPVAVSLLVLGVVFWWIYGRFAGKLYFVLDDTIETYAALLRTWPQALAHSFSGQINWSGYRPVSYAVRAAMSHLFGLERMAGYYVVTLGLHLVNTLLLFALARRLLGAVAWAIVAAIFFLLLPSHNEAVLYMSANANLLALLFSLVALLAALSPPSRPGRGWWDAFSVAAYLLAVLAYEVTLPLPLFVLLAQWRQREVKRRVALYLGYGVAISVALALRFWASDGRLTPARSDYVISFAPLHLAQGYGILLGQMILLHTSAWIGLPLYANIREWMSPFNPRAVVSIIITVVGSVAALWFALSSRWSDRPSGAEPRRSDFPFWIGWGLLWVAAMSVLFAALAGRYPENRYTYIPSLGLSVAVGALVGWVYGALKRRQWLANAWLGLVIVLLAGYAYTSTSDVSAWERASRHTQSFMVGAVERLPALPTGAAIAQVGLPGVVGNVFTFNTEESFRAAMQLLYGAGVRQTWGSDLALHDALLRNPELGENAALLLYDRNEHTVHLAQRAILCPDLHHCRSYHFGLVVGDPSPWIYLQLYRAEQPQEGGIAMIIDAADPAAPRQAVCWAFYDLKRAQIDPTRFDNAALAARCQQVAAEMAAAGSLAAPAAVDKKNETP